MAPDRHRDRHERAHRHRVAIRGAARAVAQLAEERAARTDDVWLTFMDPARREMLPDWEEGARRLLARFRADYASHVGDPAFEKLVEALNEGSSEFRQWWPHHEVLGSAEGRKTIAHPTAGTLLFEHALFRHGENPEQRLLLYSPLPEEDTPAKLERLLKNLE